jgi:hypothetical protein
MNGFRLPSVRATLGRMASFLWRALVAVHRYLGVAVGLLMLMWFASGIVMMYVGFPEPNERERLSALSPVSWHTCCRIADGLIADDTQFRRAQIEDLMGTPVLQLSRVLLPDQVIDLAQGEARPIEMADAQAIALDAVRRPNRATAGAAGTTATVVAADELEDEDQWTVGRYHSDQPLFRFGFDDPQRSTLYVSGASGRIVLRTTAKQRFWNWLGAVPHWFYPTVLRSHGQLWSQTVIWASVLGAFLTLFGLYLGVTQLGRGKGLSPYRGLFYWHHLAGLVFGIVTLTFVASGLVSMNPWGFLESRGGGERARLEGRPLRWSEIKTSLDALRGRSVNAVSLASAPFDGQLYWLAAGLDGAVTRLDAAGNAALLPTADLAAAALRVAGAGGVAEQGLLGEEDAYYFGEREPVALPVYRVIANDAARTRFYLDPVSGALLRRADANARWHRWLFGALHRLDFAAALRARPAWDVVMIALLLGGIGVSATGVYLAFRRVRRDVATLLRMVGGVLRSAAGPREASSTPQSAFDG